MTGSVDDGVDDGVEDGADDGAPRRSPASAAARRGAAPAGRRTALLAVLLLVVVGLAASPAAARVRPLVNADVPDPSIVRTGDGRYVVVGTGEQVVRMSSTDGRRWRLAGPALLDRPGWAGPSGSIWASDLVRLGGRWVLYYAAPVRGLSTPSHCIGVATAGSATGRFRPVG